MDEMWGPRDLLSLAEWLWGQSMSPRPVTEVAGLLQDRFGSRARPAVGALTQMGAYAFQSRFGRPGREEEPFIWSPFELAPVPAASGEVRGWLAAVLAENGWTPAEVYAFERTGLVLASGESWDLLDAWDQFSWLEAVYEYEGSN